MTLEDARDLTVAAIIRACADLEPGHHRCISPRKLAALWKGAPETLAGKVARRFGRSMARTLEAESPGITLVAYDAAAKTFIVHKSIFQIAPAHGRSQRRKRSR
jgi:hypothetical protein